MSTINFIATTQSSNPVTTRKSTAQPVAAAQPTANTVNVTISSDAARRANYEQRMAEIAVGYTQMRANNISASNLTSPAAAQFAYDFAHANFADGMGSETSGSGLVNSAVSYDISQTLPPGDGILRYSSGETVTPESQAYWKQQATSFHNDLLKLYNAEVAKKTPPGEMLNKFLDLQGQQPERFRSMMMWPPATDFANNK